MNHWTCRALAAAKKIHDGACEGRDAFVPHRLNVGCRFIYLLACGLIPNTPEIEEAMARFDADPHRAVEDLFKHYAAEAKAGQVPRGRRR